MRSTAWRELVYQRLPIPLQNLACCCYGWREARVRFDTEFYSQLERLANSEWWSAADIAGYQDERLAILIDRAYSEVAHYHDMMSGLGLKPADVRCRADLQKLPILSKEDVRHGGGRMVSSLATVRSLVKRHTSGTTGKSLSFSSTGEAIAFQWAIWWRHRTRFGLSLGDWHVNFTGKLVVPALQARPPYWRWNSPMHQVLINMHHLTPPKVGEIVDFLNDQSFSFYSGYPSVVHALAMAADQAGVVLKSRPRVVVTGAENVLEFQRRDILRLTGAVMTDQYGLSEGCGNVSECPAHVYHEDFEFGIIECVDPVPLTGSLVRGRIICTGFACPEAPFIRYDTGDVGVWSADPGSCRCGRHSMTLVGIEGRADQYVVTPEGRRIMRFDYVFKDTPNVRESQVVQERAEEIILKVVRRPGYGIDDEQFIAREIARRISPRLKVRFEYVTEIEPTRGGKFSAVVSQLATTTGET